MEQIFKNMASEANFIDRGFIDPFVFYMKMYNRVPHNLYITGFDYDKGYACLKKEYAGQIAHEFHKYDLDCLDKKEKRVRTVMVLQCEIVMELGDDYCDLFYADGAADVAEQLKKRLSGIRRRERKTSQEINIITKGEYGLELVDMEVKRTSLDIDLHYGDDFKEVDAVIRKRLNKKGDKGIVLLHGASGTGKTTYLRYLIGKIKKQVLFIPPNLAGQITNPGLVKLLIDNPECVLIIEDAENVIMQRHAREDSSVSNLLNISDGLLSDFLNVQVICTFNSPLSAIDEALLRKGRLIAKYEFGKLSVDKAQRLSDKLGYSNVVSAPQSLAEVFNQHEKTYETPRRLIGFRQSVVTA